MKQLWQAREMPGNIIDITPSSSNHKLIKPKWGDVSTRGQQIKEWLLLNPTESFVILDDIDDEIAAFFPSNFINTIFEKGIDAEVKAKAIDILRKPSLLYRENAIYKKAAGKKVFYFDPLNLILDSEDEVTEQFKNRQLQEVLKAQNFDHYICASSLCDLFWTVSKNEEELIERLYLILQQAFPNQSDFYQKTIPLLDSDNRSKYFNLESNWYYLDLWSDKYFMDYHNQGDYERLLGKNIFDIANGINREKIIAWLTQ